MKANDLRTIKDVLILTIPKSFDLSEEARPVLLGELDAMAETTVLSQYLNGTPRTLLFESIEWLITDKIDDVEKFQPVHDCHTCRQGNIKAKSFLQMYPGRFVALGNIVYIESW